MAVVWLFFSKLTNDNGWLCSSLLLVEAKSEQFQPGLIWIVKGFAKKMLFTKVIYNFLSFLHSFPTLFGNCLLNVSSKISAFKRTPAGGGRHHSNC